MDWKMFSGRSDIMPGLLSPVLRLVMKLRSRHVLTEMKYIVVSDGSTNGLMNWG